jgi:hypothetical protein
MMFFTTKTEINSFKNAKRSLDLMVLMKNKIYLLGETNQTKKSEEMLRQSVLTFKLKRREERISVRSGFRIYPEFLRAINGEIFMERS